MNNKYFKPIDYKEVSKKSGFLAKTNILWRKRGENEMGQDFNYVCTDRMRERMNELGLSYKQLSKKSGVSPMAISNMINGHVVPRVNTALYIADALEIGIEELVCL